MGSVYVIKCMCYWIWGQGFQNDPGLSWGIPMPGIARTADKTLCVFSQNGACLVGKMMPHPVGVFCTHLEAPKCHIVQKTFVDRLFILFETKNV